MQDIILLHKDIYIPEKFKNISINLQKKLTIFTYSKHMKEHLTNLTPDRSHKYFNGDITREDIDKLILSLNKIQREVFEVELTYRYDKWMVTKYCCRIPFTDSQDLVVAIRPRKDTSLVVTAWLNSIEDKHFTLDKSKYISKENCIKLYNII